MHGFGIYAISLARPEADAGIPPDTDPPGVSGNLVIAADGLTGVITLDEDCDETSVPAAGDFGLNGTPAVVDGVSFTDATHIELTFDVPILNSSLETVTWDYTAGANPIRDLALNNLNNIADAATTNNSTVQLALMVATYFADATHTAIREGRPVTRIAWGAGGGGDGDNNLTNSAAGGGGECALKTDASAESSYSFVAGVGGSGGQLGTATAGTDSTWADSGGVDVRATGGGAGTSGASPTGGQGGTGGVGDTTNAGGNGATGTGNCSGGGSGGASTEASGLNAGAPDGGVGAGALATQPGTGGGVGSTGAVGANGGVGYGRIECSYAVDLSYPRFDTGTFFRLESNATSSPLVRPGVHAANDRLLIIGGLDGADGGASIPVGTKLADIADAGNVSTLLVFGVESTGSESLTITHNNEMGSFWCFRIKNADPVANWSITAQAKAATTNSDPPSHTHAAGSKPILWVTAFSFDAPTGPAGFSFPAGWDVMRIWTPAPGNTTGGSVAIAAKVSTTDTENPGSFDHSASLAGGIMTMAIPLLGS